MTQEEIEREIQDSITKRRSKLRRISLWKKFAIHFMRHDEGWAIQILFGLVYLVIRWNYSPAFKYWDKETGIDIGYIPWGIRESEFMPAWKLRTITKRYSEYQP